MSETAWPPDGPTTLAHIIPAYVYQQYSDDEDIQALCAAQNQMAQAYLDWFNQIELPVYTNPSVSGALLDWVGAGLYGMPRPSLANGNTVIIGPLNTFAPNELAPNELTVNSTQNYYVVNDDIYRRILTWHFYKGDGRVFDIRWLKRRIMRFLIGYNGTAPNTDTTYQISISFGVGDQVVIRIIESYPFITGGAIPNMFAANEMAPNQLDTEVVMLPPVANAVALQQGIATGVLEMPFQFSWVVIIENATAATGLINNGGVVELDQIGDYPTSPLGLSAGQLWSNGLLVCIVDGHTPNPAAPPVYFAGTTAGALLASGGGDLPLANPGPGSGQLWNNGGLMCIA